MSRSFLPALLLSLLAAAGAAAATDDGTVTLTGSVAPATMNAAEAAIVGTWREHATPGSRHATPEGYIILMTFDADHRLTLYPSCNELVSLKRAGQPISATGTWQLAADGRLVLTAERGGKVRTLPLDLRVRDGALVITTDGVKGQLDRWNDTLPPACGEAH